LVFETKTTQLEEKLTKLKQDEYNAHKARQYHRREKENSANEKDFEKHDVKDHFFTQQLEKIRLKIQSVEGQIAAENLRIKEEEYRSELKSFYLEMSELLKTLKDALSKVMQGKLEPIDDLASDLFNVFTKRSLSFKKEDLEPFQYLNLQSVKIRIARILEEHGEMVKITSLRGPEIAAQKRTNIETWTKQLIGQIDSALEMLKIE